MRISDLIRTPLSSLGKAVASDGAAAPGGKGAALEAAAVETGGKLPQILEQYNVRQITPREFSQFIQDLQATGELSTTELDELTRIRLELDQDQADPDQPLDLVDRYTNKLTAQQARLDRAEDVPGEPGAVLPQMLELTRRQLAWLEKFELIQTRQGESGVNTLA